MFNSSYFQNYLWVVFTIALVAAALLAHTCIIWLAIAGAFVFSTIFCRLVFKKWWNGELISQYPEWKRWLIVLLVALIGSQMGWVALLI